MPRPLFSRQIIPVNSQAFTLGGGALSFALPRESLVDQINLVAELNITTGAATAHVDGLPALFQNITLNGSMAGGRFEPIVGLQGIDLYSAAQWHRGMLPYSFGALGTISRARITIPLYFREFFFSDPLKNLLPALPAWRCSDLTLTVTPATQAQVDTNAAPTMVIANGKIGLEVMQFHRDSVPDNMEFIKGTFETLTIDAPTTANPREDRLPAGGDYTFLGMRAYTSTVTPTAVQADTGITGPLTWPDGYSRLYEVSRTIKTESDFARLRASNLEYIVDSLLAGNAAFLFNRTGEAGVFQTGAIGQMLNYVLLHQNITTIANSRIRYIYRRLFDPSNLLNIQR